MPPQRTWVWFVVVLIANFLLMRALLPEADAPLTVPYTLFKEQVTKDNVQAIYSRGETLTGRFAAPVTYPPLGELGDSGVPALPPEAVAAMLADVEQRKTNEMIGAELGYRYVGSPVITDEPGGPEHLFRDYIPTTWPGARLPHVWLAKGTPMQDLIGPGYTLLRLGRSKADPSALERSMLDTGAPFETLTVPDEVARDVYGYDLILLRPDMHVVWRGNVPPEDPVALAALVTGNT